MVTKTENELLAERLLNLSRTTESGLIGGISGFLGGRAQRRGAQERATLEEEQKVLEADRRAQIAGALGGFGVDPSVIEALPTATLETVLAERAFPKAEEGVVLAPGERLAGRRTGDILAEIPSLPPKAQSKIGKIQQDVSAGIISPSEGQEAITREIKKTDPFKEQLAAERKLERLDKKVQQFSQRIEKTGVADVLNSFEQLNRLIPAEGDIPGFGTIEGGIPTIVTGESGKEIRQQVATLRNTLLALRSGAAVTDQERERIEEELGVGAFKTEAELRRGIQNARKILENKLKNVEAGFTKDVVNEFAARGGATTSSLKFEPSAPQKGKRIVTRIDPATGRVVIQ